MGAITGFSVFYGDSRRLTHGFDYSGNVCGVDIKGKPYLYYCGSYDRLDGYPKRLDYRSKSCVASCPRNDSENIECLMKAFHNFTDYPKDTQHDITFEDTLNVDITQSVTLQKTYPTELFHGVYCVPDKGALREQTISQMRGHVRVAGAAGSLRHGWPVPVATVVLAMILCLVFLHILRNFAGPLLFASLCVGTLLLLIMGLFFTIGMFFDSWNLEGGYQQMNPLMATYPGGRGKSASVVLGLVLVAFGLGMALATYHSIDKIDESIGVIQVACDCMFQHGEGGWDMITHPLWQSLSVLALVAVLCWGWMLVASVGYLNAGTISINDHIVQGLEKEFQYFWGWHAVMWFWGICAVWLVLTLLAAHQFALSYAVCHWYFVPIHETTTNDTASRKPDPLDVSRDPGARKLANLRLQGPGLNDVQGTRTGYIKNINGKKTAMIPLDDNGPDGSSYVYVDEDKEMHFGVVERGFIDGVVHHLGGLAIGSLVSIVTAPFRIVAQLIKAFIATGSGGVDAVDQSPSSLAMSGFALLANMLEHIFGGYGRGAYVDIVLSSSGYLTAGQDAVNFIAEVGGVVAFLHGSTALYELVGVVVVTAACSWAAFLVVDLPFFKDPAGAWYISDPWEITVVSVLASGIVASSFMALFNVTADTLLYVFAWSRHHYQDELAQYCPHSLRNMVKEEFDRPAAAMLKASKGNTFNQHKRAAQSHMNTIMSTMRSSRPAAGAQESVPLMSLGAP